MAHNPPRFEWIKRRRNDEFACWLMVNRRLSGEVTAYNDDAGPFFAGFAQGVRVPGRFDTVDDAQAAVEEAYRDARWGRV